MRTLVVLGSLIGLAAVSIVLWLKSERMNFAEDDKTNLSYSYDRWAEAGRPLGADISNFMRGRDAYLTLTNRTIMIESSNYFTLFALKELGSGYQGTLYVTTNRELIWVDSSGAPHLAKRGGFP